jgi:TRAP-type uncharacterized transport system fused permease subunit
MLLTAKSVAAAVVAEVPNLPPLVADLRQTLGRLDAVFLDPDSDLHLAIRAGHRASEQLAPLVADTREAVAAWKTAGQAVSIACAVVGIVAVVGLIVLSTWKPEEFR